MSILAKILHDVNLIEQVIYRPTETTKLNNLKVGQAKYLSHKVYGKSPRTVQMRIERNKAHSIKNIYIKLPLWMKKFTIAGSVALCACSYKITGSQLKKAD